MRKIEDKEGQSFLSIFEHFCGEIEKRKRFVEPVWGKEDVRKGSKKRGESITHRYREEAT